MPNWLPTRYLLSLGGGYWRLWDRQQGLLLELPPAVVIDKETQMVKLYGQEAAQIEGKLPAHLFFQRAWWQDELIDRELTRSLLGYMLHQVTSNFWERQQVAWQTQLILPETVSSLHQRWLLRTAREAGWWLTNTQPAAQLFLTKRSQGSLTRTQAVLDVGFSATRLIVYVGSELVLASSNPQLSLRAVAQQMSNQLHQKQLEVASSVFYDQHWQQTRYVFDTKKQEAKSYAPTTDDWQAVQQEYFQQLNRWLHSQLQQLSQDQQAELHELGIWVVGGAASLLADTKLPAIETKSKITTKSGFRKSDKKSNPQAAKELPNIDWPAPFNHVSDARFAVLRAGSKEA